MQLIAPQYVKPFVKPNKNDAAEAEAICEAVSRPNMPGVPVKNGQAAGDPEPAPGQAGTRQGEDGAQANQIRGLLAEYGITIPQGITHIAKRVPEILEEGENDLPGQFRRLIQRLINHLKERDRQAKELEVDIQVWHRQNSASQKLAMIPGVGALTRLRGFDPR